VIAGNKLTFTPVKDWNGTTTLTYRATDSKAANSNTATITITVNPVNDAPVVQPINRSMEEDTQLVITLVATDIDSNPPFVFEIIGTLDEEEGRFTLEGDKLTIIPTEDWNGQLDLSYRAQDPEGDWSEVEPISIEVTYVNDAPVETGATIPTKEGMTSDHVEPWVVDVDLPYGDEHTFEIVTQPANGTAKVIYGMLEYTPKPQFFGNDSFVIRATDKEGAFVDGQVNVVVDKFNYAPTDIVPGVVTLYAGIGGTAEIQVVDPNTWGSHVLEVVSQPAHGTASINGNVLTLRTDDDTETTVRLKATDQDGLVFEKNIVVKFASAWGMFDGRDVVPSGAQVSVPAVKQFMTRRNGTHALLLEDTAVLSALGSDIVALVTPDSPVGVTLEHRELAPEIGMRLTPTRLTSAVLEARVAGLDVGVDGTAQLYLSRADMQGPVYSVPVKSWAPQGSLESTAWEIRQGVDKTAIRFESAGNACVISTAESQVKPKNVLQEPTCLIEWTAYPEEWRNSGNSTLLSIEAMGKTAGLHPVKASAFVFDPQGGKHWIADFDHNLTVTSAADIFSFGLQPAPAQTYQSVQNLALVMRQSGGTACDLTTTQTIAQNAAKQWPSKPMCFIRWTSMPEGMAQSSSWHVPQAVGAPTVLGAQSISWKASVFTPAGDEIDLSMGSHDLE
ncbi:MAG: Ig-like domain-containing protein, partial [Corynebacterium casei]